jgi:hypothetical protein
MLNRVAKELEQLWWPDPKAEKRRRSQWHAENVRYAVDAESVAIYRKKGVKRSQVWEEMARYFGHNSGEALRKSQQSNRVNRKPRRKPRG